MNSNMSSSFEDLQKQAKRLAAEGKLYESLEKFELARKIQETPKILKRIQKLNEVIAQIEKEDPSTEIELSSLTSANSEKMSGVLNQIQNIELKPEIKSTSAEQNSESLKRFNELKSRAIGLSYEGKFDESLRCFREAQKLRDCPKVKKYIQDLEALVSKCPEKLEEFQKLTNTGKKLASAGKHVESLEKLKNAFAVCPSPAVSRMIKKMEAENTIPDLPVFSDFGPEEHLKSNARDAEFKVKANNTVFASHKKQENLSGSFKAANGGSSDFSLSSGSLSRSTSADPSDLSPEERQRFKCLYSEAKELARVGELDVALEKLEEARGMCPAERILKRIKDLKEHMKQQESSDGMLEVSDGFFVYQEIYHNLYPYQREGVAWMWKLFQTRKGGILGDDMGLGKTFQVIAFLSGLIDAEQIKYALIIMPVSLLPNWEKEFKRWAPGISVSFFHGTSKKERERNLLRVQRRGHVLLTSYGMVLNGLPLLKEFEGRSFVWDYVILDEGHKIKNPTKTTKAVHDIPSKNRLVLTGTPIQNNLLELWALYDFAHQGTLLGSLKTFKMQYENTISRAREKDSTAGEKLLGTQMAESLKTLIKPYFLRRTKAEIWKDKPRVSDLEKEMGKMSLSENKLTARKNDLIVWTFMSDAQCEIYRSFLHSDAVRTILMSKRSPLVELTTLKKICDHPRLLSQRACLQLGLNGELNEEDLQRELDDESLYSSSIDNVTDEVLMEESGKMKFLINLLENLKSEGHRTLVFSLSRKILDMINRILINRRWKVLRIDGTISKIKDRESRIQLFQNDASYSVFLLTTQVGGVGITLTAADRVVIYDPSWNPATDAQAVDRIYRIGQKNNVVVYRLITCGTVEEKIYRRQIFKDSITKQATSSSDPYRYFSKQELRELFTFDNPHHSATQVQLSELHSHQRTTDCDLDAHIAFLYSLGIFGVSDHDLMFSRKIEDTTEDNDEEAVSHEYIKKQVAAAQVQIQTEASVVAEGIRLAGTFSRPFAEHVPNSKRSAETVTTTPSKFKELLTMNKNLASNKSSDTNKYNLKMEALSGNKISNYEETSAISSNREFVPKASIMPFPNVPFHTVTPLLSERCGFKSQEDSVHKNARGDYDLSMNKDIPIIELNSDDDTDHPNKDMGNSSSEEYQSLEILEETFSTKSEGHSIYETPAQLSLETHKDLSTNVQDVSLVPFIELECEKSRKTPVVSIASPISSNRSICSHSEFPNKKSAEEISIHNQDSEADTNSDGLNSLGDTLDPEFSPEETENPEVSSGEIKATEVSSEKMEAPKVTSRESEDPEVTSRESEDPEVTSRESEDPKVTSRESEDPEVSSEETEDPEVSSREIEPPEVSLGEIETSEVSSAEIKPLDVSTGPIVASTPRNSWSPSSDMAVFSLVEKPQITPMRRRSCVLSRPMLVSESDSSCPSSPSKRDQDELLASTDSESDASEEEDSISFVPSSIPSSPAVRDRMFLSRAESPSARRITPLKVRKSRCGPPDPAFAQALASSPVIQPRHCSSGSDVDSPVQGYRPAGRRNAIESSDEDC